MPSPQHPVGLCPTTDDVAKWPTSMLTAFLKFGELAVAKPYVLDRLRAELVARAIQKGEW